MGYFRNSLMLHSTTFFHYHPSLFQPAQLSRETISLIAHLTVTITLIHPCHSPPPGGSYHLILARRKQKNREVRELAHIPAPSRAEAGRLVSVPKSTPRTATQDGCWVRVTRTWFTPQNKLVGHDWATQLNWVQILAKWQDIWVRGFFSFFAYLYKSLFFLKKFVFDVDPF